MSEHYDYDAIIIGAGIGGLTAGNILAKNGMKVLILEKNHVAGGAVTTFYRNGYPIDISHSLCALRNGGFIKDMFEYLEIYDKLRFIELDKTFVYLTPNRNKPILCYCDLNKYSEELSQIFPDQRKNITKIFRDVESIWRKEILNSYCNPGALRLFSYLFRFPHLVKYRNFTFDKFLNQYTSSADLKDIISVGWPYLGLRKELVSAIYMFCLIGAYHADGSFFVKGGFGRISEALVSNFRKLGGEIKYKTEVVKVILKNNKSIGVKDKNGNSYFGHRTISNIDSKGTFLNLIGKESLPNRFSSRIENCIISKSVVQVHIIAEASIGKEYLSAGSIVLPFKVNLEEKLDTKNYTIENLDAPELVISINRIEDFVDSKEQNLFVFNVCWFPANYNLWNNRINSSRKDKYELIKKDICNTVIGALSKVWNIKNVKFTNVLTPVSMQKWLNATDGAIYDLAAYPNQMLLNRLKNTTCFKNFYLVGAKTFPGGGIAGALISAFSFSDYILKGKLTKGKFAL